MPSQSLDRRGDALYLIDDTGKPWRVHDAHFTGGKPHRVPLGDRRANTRYFVAQDGVKMAYTFGKDARRDLSVETRSAQPRGAEFLGAPFDTRDRF